MVENKLKIFCRNIVYIRKKLKLSKTKMADVMGIGIGTYNKIEKGLVTSRVDISVIYALYDNLGLSADALLSGDEALLDRQISHILIN